MPGGAHTGRHQPPLPAEELATIPESLSGFDVASSDAHLVLDADQLAEREQLSWFDALIAEAANRSRCAVLALLELSLALG